MFFNLVLSQLYWVAPVAIIITLLAFLPLLLPWWRSWRAQRQAKQALVKRQDGLRGDHLHKIFRKFMAGQPWRYRASVAEYPTVIVLGPAGAGKSLLIDTQVDWKAQKQRFFPSVTDDPLLQIYLGSKVAVQEVSASLLADDSASARRSLNRLWRASAARRPPAILVVLDGAQLAKTAPEELRRQAQLMRGKIHLLQEIHKQPMRVSVVLTHMDSYDGFTELVRVCRRHQLPSASDLSRFADEKDHAPRLFGQHEQNLALALTSLTSEKFRRLVELIGTSGPLGSSLGAFLVPLVEPSRLSAAPALDRLFLFSPDPELQVDRVFAPARQLEAGKTAKLQQHLIRCAVAAVGVAVYLGFAHAHHAHQLARARAAVTALGERVTPSSMPNGEPLIDLRTAVENADRSMLDVRSAELWWPPLRWSSKAEKAALAGRYVDSVRAAYLMPLLTQCTLECREITLYVIALMYASHDDALGQLIGANARHWSTNLGIPERVVTSYLDWSPTPWRQAVPLALLSRLLQGGELSLSQKPWKDFLEQLQAAYDAQEVSGELNELQERAQQLLDVIERSRKFTHVPMLTKLLPEATPLDVATLLRAPRREEALGWVARNAAVIEGLLTMVRQGDLSPAVLGHMTAGNFVGHVDKLLRAGATESFTIELGKRYSFQRQRWLELVARASVRIYVRQPGYPFLPRDGAKEGNAVGDPPPDAYRRIAVDGTIRPALDEFGKTLSASPLPAADKASLSAYVLDQMSLYAQRYREALLSTEMFHLQARSPLELQGAVAEMIQPGGGLMRWLHRLAEDADLGKLDTAYLRPLGDAVAPLQPLVRLVKPPKDAPPGGGDLGKYIGLITRLSRELMGVESRDPYGAPQQASAAAYGGGAGAGGSPADEGQGDPEGLARLLSPIGRVSMQMLLQPQQSYLVQTQLWLDEVGLTGDLRRPFLEPFDRVLDFGVPEIEGALKTQWNRAWDKVAPLFGKYPFRRDAGRDASPEEFDIMRYGSAFWGAFRTYEAPFCMQRGNSWFARTPLPRRVNLPAGMLGRVNLVARLARIFWDKEGKRIPLDLTVTALPLPKEVGYDGYVTMSFLRAGGASVFGFNQKPIPKSFQPQWWSTEGASMGITFGDNEYHAAPDRTLDVPESTWSLYRLMEKAKAIDDKLVWTLPADGPKHKAVGIRFIIRGDQAALRPWTVVGDERPARGSVKGSDIVSRGGTNDLTNRARDAIGDKASDAADGLKGMIR